MVTRAAVSECECVCLLDARGVLKGGLLSQVCHAALKEGVGGPVEAVLAPVLWHGLMPIELAAGAVTLRGSGGVVDTCMGAWLQTGSKKLIMNKAPRLNTRLGPGQVNAGIPFRGTIATE